VLKGLHHRGKNTQKGFAGGKETTEDAELRRAKGHVGEGKSHTTLMTQEMEVGEGGRELKWTIKKIIPEHC